MAKANTVTCRGAVSVSDMPLKDCPPAMVADICTLKMQHWPHPLEAQLDWWRENSDFDDRLIRLLVDGDLAAFLRLRRRHVVSGESEISALCATEVCVAEDLQSAGLGRQLMKAATEVIAREKDRIGYLLCRQEQSAFYAKCGWSAFNEPIRIQAESGKERRPAADERCFVFDPRRRITGTLTIIGDIF